MARGKEDTQKIAELNSIFTTLNDSGKNSALTILRTLSFAQSVINKDTHKAADAGGPQAAGSK